MSAREPKIGANRQAANDRLAYRRTYPLRKGYSVEFILDNGRLDARWSPRCPGHRCSRKLLHAYRDARNHFIKSLGLPALVIEL